jgi:ATP-dependent Lon protease
VDTIPRPLLDRMEIIEIGSYTDEEKVQIAKRYLLPAEHEGSATESGVASCAISDAAMRAIIAGYTRESGVRTLRRELGRICRKTAMKIVDGKTKRASVTPKNLTEFLGPVKIHPRGARSGQGAGSRERASRGQRSEARYLRSRST